MRRLVLPLSTTVETDKTTLLASISDADLLAFVDEHAETCCLSFEERCAEHDRLTAENAPPLNPQGKPDWMHPDFERCSNDWWRLGMCDHCRTDGGCKAHARKQFPTLFPDNV